MGSDNSSQGDSVEVRMMRNDIKYLNRDVKRVVDSVEKLEASMVEVAKFMAAQEEKNNNAQSEREKIFKASTLLPVAILTAVINIGINTITKSEPVPQKPVTQVYIPTRNVDPKETGTLRVVDGE